MEPTLEFTGEDKLTIFPRRRTWTSRSSVPMRSEEGRSGESQDHARLPALDGDVIEKVEGFHAGSAWSFHSEVRSSGDKATLADLDGKDVEKHVEGTPEENTPRSLDGREGFRCHHRRKTTASPGPQADLHRPCLYLLIRWSE